MVHQGDNALQVLAYRAQRGCEDCFIRRAFLINQSLPRHLEKAPGSSEGYAQFMRDRG